MCAHRPSHARHCSSLLSRPNMALGRSVSVSRRLMMHLPPASFRKAPRARAAARAAEEVENPLSALRELLGATGDDPGHWNFSPEWWGTQGGGWGRDAGRTVFAAHSAHGNGEVMVTAHECSLQEGPPGSVQEWRVLRFNNRTRQSVARVTAHPPTAAAAEEGAGAAAAAVTAAVAAADAGGQLAGSDPTTTSSTSASTSSSGASAWVLSQQADCLAPEYLKTMASLAAALLGLQGLVPLPGVPSTRQGPLRVLVIGLGGGSLPLFLAHHFPRALVDAVEIDPVVVAAASQAMGLPTSLPNLRLHTADAVQFVAEFVAGGGQEGQHQQGQGQQQWQACYDLVFIDAFDGENNTPGALCSPGFAAQLSQALHPQHGTLVINMHCTEDSQPPLLPSFLRGPAAAPADLGYNPEGRDGERIATLAATFAGALRAAGPAGTAAGAAAGGPGSRPGKLPAVLAFTVAVPRQKNVELVVGRGLPLESDRREAALEVAAAAAAVAVGTGYRFPAGKRASKGFCFCAV